MSGQRFTTRTPAPTWEDGLVTGSGRVGAIVHGASDRLVVSLAHERFFLPANPRPAAPKLGGVLAEMRERLLRGDGAGASGLLEDAARESGYEGLIWTDPLGMCARLSLTTPGGVADASRTTDLARGLVRLDWRDEGGAAHSVQLLAPRGTDSVWIAVEAESEVEFGMRLGLDDDDTVAASFAPDYSGVVRAVARPGDPGRLDVHRGAGERLVRVVATAGCTWIVDGDGALVATVTVPAGGRVLLRLDVAVTGFAHVPAEDADWEGILSRQSRAHCALVEASALDLRGRPADTTEQLWERARTGDTASRRRAVEIAYAAGRSHVIASTGDLPPTLQGVWQGTWKPAWSADYTLNGNVQNGAIAALITTGTPELAASLLELVLPFSDDYRANAARVYGAAGMLLPSRMSTHGRANHFDSRFPHLFWTGCGAWVLRFAADLVSVTGDRTVVDDRLWALVEGVLQFAETASVRRDGRLHLVPSYSPENTPGGADSPLAADSTADVALLRDAARSARVLAAARGDDSLNARWAALAAALPDYRIADDGSLAEWIAEPWREQHAHRHASHLYPLWYEIDPAFAGDSARAQDLRAAAKATIAAKLRWRAADPTPPPGHMEMAFGLVQLGLAAAALGDGDSALVCAEWLALEHWSPALTSRHDAGRILNLDASGGLPALVAAMLLSSTADELTVLPAVPERWGSGRITGLRARGGIVVDDLEWDEVGCSVQLRRLPGVEWLVPEGLLRLRSGRPFVTEGHDDTRIALEPGASVRLRLRWGQGGRAAGGR